MEQYIERAEQLKVMLKSHRPSLRESGEGTKKVLGML